jgi:prepilin-type N-terminal cleavage/methylation domain-containing protein
MCYCQPIYRELKKRSPLSSKFRPAGFTLVELLIAVSIFSVVSIAIYATFNSGMTVWRRAKDTSGEERTFLLRTEKLSRELRQAFNSGDIPFSASKNKIQFPSIIDSDICRIIYSFDQNKKILSRSGDKLTDILAADKKELEPKFSSYLSGIDELTFSYLIFDLSKNAYTWKEEWKEGILPIAVKVTITAKAKTYATIVIIPSA